MIARPLERLLAVALTTLPDFILKRLGGGEQLIKGETLDPRTHLLVRLSQHVVPLEQLPIHRAREVHAQRALTVDHTICAGIDHSVRLIPRLKHFESMRMDVFKPENVSPNAPCILFMHGGGWSMGDSELIAPFCSILAQVCQAVVFSPNYLLAPEHPFPAGLHDCVFAYEWVGKHGARGEGVQGAPRMVVGGDCAGATLAIGVCQHMLDKLSSVQPVAQLLVNPYTDLTCDTESHQIYADQFFLTHRLIDWFKSHYLTSSDDASNPLVSPLLAESVEGMPPAVVTLPGFSPLKDEGRAYARRLEEAGIPVTVVDHPHQAHAYVTYGEFVPAARQASIEDAWALKNCLDSIG